MDGVYAPLAYDGAPLLRVPVCVSRALLVCSCCTVFNAWNDWVSRYTQYIVYMST